MKYFTVTSKRELKAFLSDERDWFYEESSITHIIGRCYLADNEIEAKDLWSFDDFELNKEKVDVEKLYLLFLEDFCYFNTCFTSDEEVEDYFANGKEIAKIKQKLPQEEDYLVDFPGEVCNEMKQIFPLNEFRRLFCVEKDLQKLYAVLTRDKLVAIHCGINILS